MKSRPHIVILGGGPAGLGAAWKLGLRNTFRVTLLEKNKAPGGNAASFELEGMRADFGSHRLHPSCDREVLADIRNLLGKDLLDRSRHGRILLQGRWIHFPLKPLDLILRLPRRFAAGVLADMLTRSLRKPGHSDATFASVLSAGLGKTICRDFYFPYARKIWGLDPESLSATQALRRVSANSTAKMIRRVFASVGRGNGTAPKGRFFYPRAGFGQISEAYAEAARQSGAELMLGASVDAIELEDSSCIVCFQQEGRACAIKADLVLSTVPLTALVRAIKGSSDECVAASHNIHYRSMILIYLVIGVDRFTEYDAHYFPGADIPISRLSEPKNYSGDANAPGRTLLCAELPCSADDRFWDQTDQELGRLAVEALQKAGLPAPAPVLSIYTRRLRHAYPIYTKGYEKSFDLMDSWLSSCERLVTFGRQGLFAHDNTHHALFMAYAASKCLDDTGVFDHAKWREFRKIFATHVVED